jgi:hypothetical protein
MANAAKLANFTGLSTYTYHILVAGDYVFSGTLTLPTLSEGSLADSQAVVTVSQNSSLKYTGAQGARGFSVELACALNDVIAIAISSSAPVDQILNAVRTSLAID